MSINELLLIVVQSIVIILLFSTMTILAKQGYDNKLIHKYLIASASFFFSIILILDFSEFIPVFTRWDYLNVAYDWIKLSALVTLLSGLGLLIRQSKPKVTRAPIILAFLPVILIIVYPLIMDTIIIKQFIFNLLFIGAITISILMYSILSYRERNYRIVLLSLLFFTLALISGYYLPSFMAISYVSLSIALIIYRKGYKTYELHL